MSKLIDKKYRFLGHPKPLQGLFFTEFLERFSYYGIRPLLILYISAMSVNGGLGLTQAEAIAIVGLFAGSIYFVTILGGWLADHWLGHAHTVWYGSIIMIAGHFSIALTPIFDHFFFYLGLVCIVIGTGLFKTCISVMVGTFYESNDVKRDAGYSLFYIGINLGALIAPLVTSFLIEDYGWYVGFGVGGIAMLISLVIFRFVSIPQIIKFSHEHGTENTWLQAKTINPKAPLLVRNLTILILIIGFLINFNIITINPIIITSYLTILISIVMLLYFTYFLLASTVNLKEKRQLLACFILFIFSALFWSAFEQNLTSLNVFAQDYTYRYISNIEIPSLWFYSLNGLFIIILAPLLSWVWAKLDKSNNNPSYVTKFIIALVFAASAFGVMIIASQSVLSSGGALVSPYWIISTIFLLTIGELCLSPIGLSLMSKLAPPFFKGQVMGLWFTTAALGNLMASLIAGQVLQDNLQDLPIIFMRCVIALIIGAVTLFLFKDSIMNLMKNETNE